MSETIEKASSIDINFVVPGVLIAIFMYFIWRVGRRYLGFHLPKAVEKANPEFIGSDFIVDTLTTPGSGRCGMRVMSKNDPIVRRNRLRYPLWYWNVFLLAIFCVAELPSVATAQTVQEIQVQWDVYIGAAGDQMAPDQEIPSNLFTVLKRRLVSGSLPRQRNPELSSNQMVVVAVGTQGEEIDWQIIQDPRVLRAEAPGLMGEMRGETLHHVKTELLITLPDDPSIKEIRLYHPRWTGTDFVLELFGRIPLR